MDRLKQALNVCRDQALLGSNFHISLLQYYDVRKTLTDKQIEAVLKPKFPLRKRRSYHSPEEPHDGLNEWGEYYNRIEDRYDGSGGYESYGYGGW